MALIELQIMYGISHRMLETPQDVSSLVAQLTKSIAQIPYKLVNCISILLLVHLSMLYTLLL